MSQKPKPKPDDPQQSKRFIDAAREAEADETEAGADRAFKRVTKKSDRSKDTSANRRSTESR